MASEFFFFFPAPSTNEVRQRQFYSYFASSALSVVSTQETQSANICVDIFSNTKDRAEGAKSKQWPSSLITSYKRHSSKWLKRHDRVTIWLCLLLKWRVPFKVCMQQPIVNFPQNADQVLPPIPHTQFKEWIYLKVSYFFSTQKEVSN